MSDPTRPESGASDAGVPVPGEPDEQVRPPVPKPADLTPTDLTPAEAIPAPDYDERGTPSLDFVRNKIESRYATSLGATELAEDTDRVRDQAEQEAERDRKAADKLEQIRRSLG